MKKKQVILTVIGIIGLIVITAEVTLAFFNYTKTGTTENSITSGNITFLYTETSKIGRGILLQDAIPMTDSQGKAQTGTGKVFEFSITSSTGNKIAIPYEITARKSSNSTLSEDVVKVYLEKGNEEVLLDTYNHLAQTTHQTGNVVERVLYSGKIPKNSSNYSENFKLRMWIDEKADYSQGDYNDKIFKLTVNVYANGKVLTDQDINLESSVAVDSLSVNNVALTATTPNNYAATVDYGSEEAVIDVETTNPYTKVIIEKTDSTYENVISMNTGITRLSTEKRVSLSGENNYYRIRLVSENGLNSDQLNLSIQVHEPLWTYEYDSTKTDNIYTFRVPKTGSYKLEVWGAQGGSHDNTYKGGYGGYSTGEFELTAGDNYYVVIGSQGETGIATTTKSYGGGGYNGGGERSGYNCSSCGYYSSGGGGATHIASESGLLSDLSSESDRQKVLIVAGGGGGNGYANGGWNTNSTNIASGGGHTGNRGNSNNERNSPSLATQTSGYAFGRGESCGPTHGVCDGGGAGWYGGYTGFNGASGGSGYIGSNGIKNGQMYCFNCSEDLDNASTFTVNTKGSSEYKDLTNCPDGYSSNPISKCAKSGNGYAKITYLGN